MRRILLCLAVLLLSVSVCAQDNWPDYRGPSGDGHSAATGLPLKWSETQNVKWKTPIHGRGWSSPVVWGEQVWLTTATDDGTAMFVVCVDRSNGKILLDRKLFENASPEPIHDVNSYASPSPVIEAGRVYVHFGASGTACLDTKTLQTLWQRRDLTCQFSVGPGSSPVLFGDLLILTMDGTDKQFTIALDKKTGVTRWRTERSFDFSSTHREMRKAFSTPLLATVAGQLQLISPGARMAYAYDPRTGKELWKVRTDEGYSNSSRTVIGHGMAFINTGYNRADLLAVRLDGKGDVTDSHLVWKYSRNVPFKPSPALVDDLLYLVSDSGMVTCLEAKTGQEVWKERLGGSFSASPVVVEGRIYLFSEEGKVTVFKPGRNYEAVAESQLNDGFMASPAIAGKAFFLRTKKALYRIEP